MLVFHLLLVRPSYLSARFSNENVKCKSISPIRDTFPARMILLDLIVLKLAIYDECIRPNYRTVHLVCMFVCALCYMILREMSVSEDKHFV
jgi:hypothetical protein